LRKPRAAEVLAALIEQHSDRTVRNDIGERDRLFEHAPGGVISAAFADFDDFN
jgi:hypothetical protein